MAMQDERHCLAGPASCLREQPALGAWEEGTKTVVQTDM